jgi:hypothetical protein
MTARDICLAQATPDFFDSTRGPLDVSCQSRLPTAGGGSTFLSYA